MKTKILLLIIISITITSCKSIKKDKNNTITEKHWKLKTLYGKEIKMDDRQKQEIFITLKTKDNRFTGFAGCNTINGEYILEEGNKIKFSKVISTRMFCNNNTDESKLLKAINSTNNYTMKNNTLSLNIGKRAPLAVFEAVYMN